MAAHWDGSNWVQLPTEWEDGPPLELVEIEPAPTRRVDLPPVYIGRGHRPRVRIRIK